MAPLVLVPALAAWLAVPPARAADPCIAAGCIPSYVGSGVQACGFMATGYRCGQTFTPSFTGVVHEVRIGLWSLDPHDAVVEIHPTSGGLPTSAILGSATVPGAPYADVIHVADFSSQLVVLEAGVRYALVFRATGDQPVEALGSFTGCGGFTGSGDFVTSDDSGATWAIYPYDHRAVVYQICLDAATPTGVASWGSLKIRYR